MAVNASSYIGESFKALALYNPFSDVYRGLPASINGNHAMHVNYSFEGKTQSIDIYLHDFQDLKDLKIKKKLIANSNISIDAQKILREHNVSFETIADLKDSPIEAALKNIIAQDVAIYCKNPAKEIIEQQDKYPQKIIPFTSIQYNNKQGSLLTVGKAEFVEACLLEANLDFVVNKGACVAEFTPGKNMDVSFDNKSFTGYFETPTPCEYCYAAHHHVRSYPKAFLNIDQDKLYEELMTGQFSNFQGKPYGKKVDVLRLGKRTETGAKFHRDQLKQTLETAIRAKTRVVMPTKYLEYDKDIVDLLKKSNTEILYSVTEMEGMDLGPKIYGYDNDWRIDQARQYAKKGLDVWAFFMMDVVYDDVIERNWKIIDDILAKGVNVQVLSARIPTKEIAYKMTGRKWEDMIGPLRTASDLGGDLFSNQNNRQLGGYTLANNGSIVPVATNKRLVELIKHNHGRVRMCHHDDEKTWCGSCGLNKGFVTPTVHMEIERVNKKPRLSKEKTLKLYDSNGDPLKT